MHQSRVIMYVMTTISMHEVTLSNIYYTADSTEVGKVGTSLNNSISKGAFSFKWVTTTVSKSTALNISNFVYNILVGLHIYDLCFCIHSFSISFIYYVVPSYVDHALIQVIG